MLLGADGLHAGAIPSYREVETLLPELWKKTYPVEALYFKSNPEKKGILSAEYKGRRIYYFHFEVTVPRQTRKPDESIETIGKRTLELWVRFQPGLADPYDLSFARRDILPGTSKKWIKK